MRAGGRRGRKQARSLVTRLVPVLPRFLRLLGGLLVDRRVRLADRALVLGAAAYVLMPLDLVPDFLGVLGFADDLFLLALSVRRLVAGAGEEVVREHWTGSPEALADVTGGLDELGTLVPAPVRRALRSLVGSGETADSAGAEGGRGVAGNASGTGAADSAAGAGRSVARSAAGGPGKEGPGRGSISG